MCIRLSDTFLFEIQPFLPSESHNHQCCPFSLHKSNIKLPSQRSNSNSNSSITTMQSPQSLLSNSPTLNPLSSNTSFPVKIHPPSLHFNRSYSPKSTITYARSSNKGLLGSQQSRKTLIRLVRFAASNLHYVLPAPFNSVVRELGAGDGGVIGGGGGGGSRGSWNRFGWGGFDGGGGKRRIKRKSKLGFWEIVTVCCIAIWGLILAGELKLKNDVMLGAIAITCLPILLVLIRNGCVSEWVFGFCSGGVLVGLLFQKKDELQKLIKGFKAIGVSRRRRGRRALWR